MKYSREPGPLFTNAMAIARQHLASCYPLLMAADYYRLDVVPHKELVHEVSLAARDMLVESFTMPSRVVAIEDKCSVVLLCDLMLNQRGMIHDRIWMDFRDPRRQESDDFRDNPHATQLDRALHHAVVGHLPPKTLVATGGRFSVTMMTHNQWGTSTQLDWYFIGSPDAALTPQLTYEDIKKIGGNVDELIDAGARAALTAIEEIFHIQMQIGSD
jgi:hypothetical protein